MSKNDLINGRLFDQNNWLPDPNDKMPGLSMGLVSFIELVHFRLKNPYKFYELYTTMFVGDYEPYSQKGVHSMSVICDNGNAERSVITMCLLFQDKVLNQLRTYGMEGLHCRFSFSPMKKVTYDDLIETLEDIGGIKP